MACTNWDKDYCETRVNHEQLGTRELIVFDPKCNERPDGSRFQRFVRTATGQWTLVDRTDSLSIDSDVLGCAIRAVGSGSQLRLRLAESKDSLVLFPTGEEDERRAKEDERRAKEDERRAKEDERRAKEDERRAKEDAQRRVAELEALLARNKHCPAIAGYGAGCWGPYTAS